MIEVYDKNLKKLGVLENAFDIKSEEQINAVDFLYFSLHLNDKKTELCKPFNFVKHFNKFFRIMPRATTKNTTTIVDYTCEHAIATLMDSVLFGYHIIGNKGIYTADVIKYILSKQNRWTLGRCDFKRQFEYKFEQENLLGALLSVAKPITDEYMWEFGTEENPWQINLVKLSNETKHVYMNRKNIIETSIEEEPTSICTRLYPLGAGEGINQVNIKKINNNKPYIDSPQQIINKYGIIERVWVDRRYESAETLLEAAKKLLSELQEERVSYQLKAREITTSSNLKLGDVVRFIDKKLNMDIKTKIKKISRDSKNNAITVDISNKMSNIADTIAELADRQRIESTYSQGATQIYSQSIQANASANDGAELHFYIPSEMKIINKVLIKVKTEQFRAYSKATQGGGGVSKSTSSGGGSYGSTSYDGEIYTSTSTVTGIITQVDGGGGSVLDGTGSGINVQWGDANTSPSGEDEHTHSFSRVVAHSHDFRLPNHSHNVRSEPHTHNISVSSHSHTVDIPNHSHEITIPNHTHIIEPGIYRFGGVNRFKLLINDKQKAVYTRNTEEIDITEMLLNEQNIIERGKWHSVKVVPESLGYVSITLYIQGFIQSRGEMTV